MTRILTVLVWVSVYLVLLPCIPYLWLMGRVHNLLGESK